MMTMYQEGYQHYIDKCKQFGLEPINFYYFVQQLTQEQLNAFNEQAQEVKGSL